MNIQPKLLCVPQPKLEFMMLEGHISDGSNCLRRSVLRIRHELMLAFLMSITTLPVQSIGRSSGCELAFSPRLSAKNLLL